jgi:hypothetical protein
MSLQMPQFSLALETVVVPSARENNFTRHADKASLTLETIMKSFATKWIAISFAALLAAAPVLSHSQTREAIPPDYSVFLDPPTGFVFVKLPAGWKFVGKVDASDVTKIPSNVLTSVLGAGASDGVDRSGERTE